MTDKLSNSLNDCLVKEFDKWCASVRDCGHEIQPNSSTAWRIIKDWIFAQLAIIEAEVATLPQVFLPYMTNETGKTMYEVFESNGLAALTYQPTKSTEK